MKPKRNYLPGLQDNCQTPPYAVIPLLPYLQDRWIWEPAAGEGLLVAALRAGGIAHVVASDILTGQDFFTYQPAGVWSAIVTNPPYSNPLKYKFLARCYELREPFALLMPVEVLGAKTAQKLFDKHGVEVIFLDKRVNFKMPNTGWSGTAQFPVAWFTWGLNIGKEMTFGHIEPESQLRLL